MTEPFRRLGFAFLLIFLAAVVLLVTDLRSRRQGDSPQSAAASGRPLATREGSTGDAVDAIRRRLQPGRTYKVGLAYFAPEAGADSVLAGLREGLNDYGLEAGKNLEIRTLHAQGEIAQIPLLGHALDASDVDAVMTLTTPVLQGAGLRVKHHPVVFTYVFDPIAAGAGKSLEDHLPNLTGIGSFPPVEDLVTWTRKVLPGLRSVGTLYNPSEANSVKVVTVLRELCRNQDLSLEEVPIQTTADVVQAAQALVARKVGAILAIGDNTLFQAIDAVAKVARDAAIPLIMDQPEFVDHGALMVVGVDFRESGRAAAEPLARVLTGESPAAIPIRNVSKLTVLLNEDNARRLGIEFPPELRALAAQNEAGRQAAGSAHRPWRIKRLLYVESVPAEDALRGIDDGLRAAGLVAGKDFLLSTASAQGDMATLSNLMDGVDGDGTDLLFVLSTPTLEAALQRVQRVPIVFTFVADPFRIGAGASEERHLPNVTGVYTLGRYGEMAELLARHFPHIRRVGTLFSPVEDNSVNNKDLFVAEAARRGIETVTVPVNAPGELADAATALAAKPIDAIVQIPDNQTVAGFVAIVRAAVRMRKPLFAFTEAAVQQGAAVALTLDYYRAGFDAAGKAVQVLLGRAPGTIPFSRAGKVELVVSEDNARTLGLELPGELVARADRQLGRNP
jgi:ABC-type uncharacterized transport system substrate-binding protein